MSENKLTKEEGKIQMKLLIEKFEEQLSYYKTIDYNETQVRRDFIDPFFAALGWDVENKNGEPESLREVKLEYKLKVGSARKSPDYSFNIRGKSKFFAEAKKPFVSIKDQPEPALQVRNYAWNGSLLVSVVTDFEEFAIYDCTRKPRKLDRASTKRLKYIHYKDYLLYFDFLWQTFGHEAVMNGSIEQYGQKYADLKNAEPVDREFLKSLESWRTYLATNIAQLNKNLEEYALNFAVQQTIDRIVFLKVCEDRLLEKEGSLKAQIKSGNFYQNLYDYFGIADQKYNSGLFDLKKDNITDKLSIDNKVVKSIIQELYGENEDGFVYNFNIIPIEILGYAYEQFLGKVIYLSSFGSASIEEKPEVRKAGGVYYTPQYIVEYIVNETLGKLIAGKTPEEISQIKVLDPACGSGSFLIGAYEALLKYHLDYYKKNASSLDKVKKGAEVINVEGNLSTAEKKRILLNNIFGVDIDSQAVEVTKLSLLLKALEGETEGSINTSLKLFNERVLPTLDGNIQCGNSLIGSDFYNSGLFLTPKEERKINVFDWKEGFKTIMKSGGFDVVIGNPPYVKQSLIEKNSFDYYLKNYTIFEDLYSLFIEKATALIKKDYNVSFIVPSLFIKGVQFDKLRNFINKNASEFVLKEYGDKVFSQVKMPTCVFRLKKGENINENDYFKNDLKSYFQKITTIPLGEIMIIRRGLEIGRDKFSKRGKIICLTGGDIDNYEIKTNHQITKETYEAYEKSKGIFDAPKLMVRETGNKFFATLDNEGVITTRSIYNLKMKNGFCKIQFILGLLNSKLFAFYFKSFISPETNIFPKIRIIQLQEVPICFLNLGDDKQKLAHDEIVKYVEMLLELHKRVQKATLTDKRQLETRILSAETQINEIVYQLYHLTEEEIKLIDAEHEVLIP